MKTMNRWLDADLFDSKRAWRASAWVRSQRWRVGRLRGSLLVLGWNMVASFYHTHEINIPGAVRQSVVIGYFLMRASDAER